MSRAGRRRRKSIGGGKQKRVVEGRVKEGGEGKDWKRKRVWVNGKLGSRQERVRMLPERVLENNPAQDPVRAIQDDQEEAELEKGHREDSTETQGECLF